MNAPVGVIGRRRGASHRQIAQADGIGPSINIYLNSKIYPSRIRLTEQTGKGESMAELEGKNVVVAGGTGRVGEGLVRSFLLEGAQVIVPVRSTAKDQRLRSYVEGADKGLLVCMPTHVGEEDSIQEFRKRVLEKV